MIISRLNCSPENGIVHFVPEIGHTKSDRLNLSTWQSIFRLLYTAIAMIIPGVLIKYFGHGNTLVGIRGMIISLCIIVVIGGYITVFLVPEKKYSHGETSKVSFKDTMKILFKNSAFKNYLFGLLFFFIGLDRKSVV